MELLKSTLRNRGGDKLIFKVLALLVSILFAFAIVSCAGGAGGGGAGADSDAEGTSLAITVPDFSSTSKTLYNASDITTITATITSSSYNSTKSANRGETMRFTNIPAGDYSVVAYGKTSNGNVAAKGTAAVTIKSGETTTTTIHLTRIEHFTVSFKNGATLISTQEVSQGYKVSRPENPTSPIPDSSFVNWYSDNDCTSIFDFNTAISADIEVFAKFTDVSYTVTLNYNGGQDASGNTSRSETCAYNDSITPGSITRTGYDFVGWTTTADAPIEDVITSIPNVTGNATYYAKWTPTTYTVTYHLPTGLSATVVDGYGSYTYGTGLSTLPGVTGVTGLSLEGWYEDSAYTPAKKVTSIASTATGDKDLYAKFNATVKIYKEKVSGTLTTLLDTKTVVYGGTVTALATAPTKTGYTIDTWKTGTGAGSTFTFGTSGTVISGDCDVWATWTANTYTITYHNVNVGSGSTYKGTISATARSSYTYNATSATTLPMPTISGFDYVFGGWYESSDFSDAGGGVTSIPAGSNEDKEYYAKYLYNFTDITCTVADFNAIDGFSGTSITWRVDGGPSISDIVSAIAAKNIDVVLDLSAGGISAFGAGTLDSIKNHLVEIDLPGSMTTISANTFKNYTKLTRVSLPSVTRIESGAFDGCTSLATIDGGDGNWGMTSSGGATVINGLGSNITYLTQPGYTLDRQ